MSVPAYSDYKDSGVPWLGAVPTHWGVVPGRRAFRQARDPSLETDEQLSASQKYGVIPQSRLMEMEDQKVVLALKGLDSFKHVERDDFVISLRSFQGGIEHSAFTGCVSPAYTVLRPTTQQAARYFFYALKAPPYISALQAVTDGIRDGKNISFEQFGQVGLPVPPLSEQKAIACFLDRETAKIDSLVAEQRRLIALLKEKRQAVISHAVTKGLNPNVPMTESGIEWLGEIPVHWEVGPVKRFLEFLDGKRVPLSTEERGLMQGDYPYYGASGIIDYVNDYIFSEPLVLVSEDGANLLMRNYRVAFVADGKYWVNNHAHILRPLDGLVSFWADRIESIDVTPVITGSAQPKLTADALGNLRLAVPPTVDERIAIEAFVADATAKFGPLVEQAKFAIALLQERRAALISATVTGKVDVRAAYKNALEAA